MLPAACEQEPSQSSRSRSAGVAQWWLASARCGSGVGAGAGRAGVLPGRGAGAWEAEHWHGFGRFDVWRQCVWKEYRPAH